MRTRRSQSSNDPVLSDISKSVHRSVLLHETIDSLSISPDDIVLDATLGGAGHANAIAQKLGPKGVLIGIDADHDAIVRAQKALEGSAPKVLCVEGNFRQLDTLLESEGISHLDKALFDLGWSSDQLSAGRGFSFRADEPLHMAYAAGSNLTAETIVNEWQEESLADVIFGYGEERYARRIAKAIVEARGVKKIMRSAQLAEIIRSGVPAKYARGKIHPATRTFQALRIAVNDELGSLEHALRSLWPMLAPKGRIAIISFHSLEDRIVKHAFRAWVRDGVGNAITKKPIVPSESELQENPRARSAKLRVIEKN